MVAIFVAVTVVTLVLPRTASSQDDPVEPTGRAVCHIAFTVAAGLSFGNAAVPPEAPAGPNDVVVALTPVLQACVDTYPPAPQRQCFTSDLYPNTGVPLTPPDPVGIVTEQAEGAVTAVADPLGLALAGPLHEFFASALRCEDPSGSLDDGEDDFVLEERPVLTPAPTSTPADPPPSDTGPVAARPTPAGDWTAVTAPAAEQRSAGGSTPVSESFTALISSVPEPLRGPAVAASGLFLIALAFLLRRQLTPKRRRSLADAGPQLLR